MAAPGPGPKPRPTKRRVVVGQIVAGKYERLDASPEILENTRTERVKTPVSPDFAAFCSKKLEGA